MASAPFTAAKRYRKSPFILSDRKLSRIVEVAKERFGRIKDEHEIFENYLVDFKGGKDLQIDTLENLLKLDNSDKNPIVNLRMQFSVGSERNDKHFHEVLIHYIVSDDVALGLSATSSDLTWLQETMGALEEQLERTIPTDFAYSINKSSNFIVAMSLGFLVAISASFTQPNISLKMPVTQVEELVTLSSNAKTESDKLDFVFRYLSATLVKSDSAEQIKHISKNPKTYFIGVPVLVGLVSAIVAIFYFYPRHVFAWGDSGEKYELTIERRKFLWYGVVLTLIIGVLGNLLSFGVTS